MASLMEELIEVLTEEKEKYSILSKVAEEKTPIIVAGDVNALQMITEKESGIVDAIAHLERRRRQIMSDVSEVLGKNAEELTLSGLVKMFENKPEEQKKLADVCDQLIVAVKEMDAINSRNKMLLDQALEMVDFDIQLFQGLRRAPETANYGRDAYSLADSRERSAGFDAKQ